jgi:hypothetical protein
MHCWQLQVRKYGFAQVKDSGPAAAPDGWGANYALAQQWFAQ